MGKLAPITLALALMFSASGAGATPVITDGLVAAYEFTGNADDVSGNGNNGVVNGATLTADRFGNPNSAYSFDGVDDSIVSSTSFSPQSEGAISVWFNQQANPLTLGSSTFVSSVSPSIYTDGSFLIGHNPDSNEPEVAYWGNTSTGSWFYAGGHTVDEITFPVTNDWHHLVWSWETPGGSKLYLNNELVGEAGITAPIFANHPLKIGNTYSYLFHLGLIDDVYIYDRSLSPTEVNTLYTASVPEPATGLLLGLGLLGVVARRRV